ncbi:serine threonine protein kinase [Pelomyxa schiedti]|nr:serine threonine protein kinase [Pelomyxa schiedti]
MPELPSPTWDINTPIDGSWTMLHIACYYGNESVVGQLLGVVGASRSPPIDPNKTDSHGRTPLCYAACQGHEAVVRMLVARPNVDVNKGCPLVEACSNHRMKVVVALLECPRVAVNLLQTAGDQQSHKGQTALHMACEMRFVKGVKVLLQVNGVDTNRKNINGETPLDVATRRKVSDGKYTDICNLLKDHNARIIQSSSHTLPPPQPQSQPTATTMTETVPTATRTATSNVVSKALGIIDSSNNWEIAAEQQKREITELNARITQLEDENAKNLKLLHDERKYRQNSEMELQRVQEKNVLDMTAKNNEIMELEALITTLEEESAKNLKIFCDAREFSQQRSCDLQQCMNHMMSHFEQGEGTWCNILPENNKSCKRSQIRIAFEDFPSFEEIVCAFCPLQMVAKIVISKKFGIELAQQVIFIVGPGNNNSDEELLTDSSRTLDDIQKLQQQEGSSSTNIAVQIKVRIKSSMTIQEKDLKVVSTLGVGSYGTVFKCSFLHNVATPSSSSEATTTTFVAVKALHEIIRSESNITRFQQEALISSSLRHPNIVRCLGTCICTSTGSLWIVSELMEMSLRQLLRHKDLTFTEVVAVSSGIAKGMTALHRRNYMHRDLSSNNVLLDSHGTPKITDFGVSRAIQGQIGRGSVPPMIGSYSKGAGTPIYLSPQMHTGHYGIQGDIWEFAVLLSELLQREVPSVQMPKSGAQVTEFVRVQRASLSPLEIAEVDRLCNDVGDIPVAECLGRRLAIISALRSDPKMNNNVHRACVGLFSLVVESCLSILEIDRPSFPAIDKVLMMCAEIVFTTNSRPSPSTNSTPTSDNDVMGHITKCLENIAATTFQDHCNRTE